MRLTKYTHACVRLEKTGEDGAPRVLVIDPGSFSEVETALHGAHAFLVTHEHADHIDLPRAAAALEANTSLEAWAPAKVTDQLTEAAPSAAGRIHTAEPESAFDAAGFRIQTFGSQHALIHASVPVVANIGYLVDGEVFHPGDSLTVPHGVDVPTLLVPIYAPWSKVGEVLDFLISVRPPRAYPIHNAPINEIGHALVEAHAKRVGALYGTEYTHLDTGASVDL